MIGTALRVMIHDELPKPEDCGGRRKSATRQSTATWCGGATCSAARAPASRSRRSAVQGKDFDGTVVVWIHPDGKSSLFKDGKLVPAAQKILDGKAAHPRAWTCSDTANSALDKPPRGRQNFAGYHFRLQPAAAGPARPRHPDGRGLRQAATRRRRQVHLVGLEKAGPWVLLARGLCGDAVARTAADVNGFRFEKVRRLYDEMMLPGAVKYGGLPALAALAAPGELYVHNNRGTGIGHWLKASYGSAKAMDHLHTNGDKVDPVTVAEWLVR